MELEKQMLRDCIEEYTKNHLTREMGLFLDRIETFCPQSFPIPDEIKGAYGPSNLPNRNRLLCFDYYMGKNRWSYHYLMHLVVNVISGDAICHYSNLKNTKDPLIYENKRLNLFNEKDRAWIYAGSYTLNIPACEIQ